MPWRRFILALACGAAVSASVFTVFESATDLETSMVDVFTVFMLGLIWLAPGLAIAVYIVMRGPRDTETRCRKCGYILRGISEPRCPECGERI